VVHHFGYFELNFTLLSEIYTCGDDITGGRFALSQCFKELQRKWICDNIVICLVVLNSVFRSAIFSIALRLGSEP
jgi:hypothetical protein